MDSKGEKSKDSLPNLAPVPPEILDHIFLYLDFQSVCNVVLAGDLPRMPLGSAIIEMPLEAPSLCRRFVSRFELGELWSFYENIGDKKWRNIIDEEVDKLPPPHIPTSEDSEIWCDDRWTLDSIYLLFKEEDADVEFQNKRKPKISYYHQEELTKDGISIPRLHLFRLLKKLMSYPQFRDITVPQSEVERIADLFTFSLSLPPGITAVKTDDLIWGEQVSRSTRDEYIANLPQKIPEQLRIWIKEWPSWAVTRDPHYNPKAPYSSRNTIPKSHNLSASWPIFGFDHIPYCGFSAFRATPRCIHPERVEIVPPRNHPVWRMTPAEREIDGWGPKSFTEEDSRECFIAKGLKLEDMYTSEVILVLSGAGPYDGCVFDTPTSGEWVVENWGFEGRQWGCWADWLTEWITPRAHPSDR